MRRLLLLLGLVALALAVQAPAWLLARGVQERTGGIVELRDPAGTIWIGQADALVRGTAPGGRETAIGRLAWRLERIDWQHGALVFDLRQTPPAPRPTTIAIGTDRIRIAGEARLPAAAAGVLPMLRGWSIAGEALIDTDTLEVADGARTGKARVLWRNATVVPPDFPAGFALGEVTALVTLDGAAAVVAVRNSGGDLELTADASSREGKMALLLQPRAGASAALLAWLQSHTMGRTPRGYSIDAGWPGR